MSIEKIWYDVLEDGCTELKFRGGFFVKGVKSIEPKLCRIGYPMSSNWLPLKWIDMSSEIKGEQIELQIELQNTEEEIKKLESLKKRKKEIESKLI